MENPLFFMAKSTISTGPILHFWPILLLFALVPGWTPGELWPFRSSRSPTPKRPAPKSTAQREPHVVAHPPLLDDHLIATHVDPPGDGKHKTNWGFIVKHIWNRIKYYIYYIYGIIIAIYIGDYYCETLIYIYIYITWGSLYWDQTYHYI